MKNVVKKTINTLTGVLEIMEISYLDCDDDCGKCLFCDVKESLDELKSLKLSSLPTLCVDNYKKNKKCDHGISFSKECKECNKL
jgi:hypothetical protein